MRLVTVDDVREGDRIVRNIYTENGLLVLRQGMIVTARLIEGLKRLVIGGIYIEDERFKDIQVKDNNGMRFRLNAINALNVAFEEVSLRGNFKSSQVVESNVEMVAYMSTEDDPLIEAKTIRTRAGYLLDHSVNVAMLSVLIGKALDYSTEQLHIIGIGALLHDIGYALPGLKDPFIEHPKAGFDIIRKHQDIPLMSAHLVLQHHEKVNGTGFPFGIKGKDIREMAQICAVANDFDHYVNEIDRNRLPHEGIEYIMSKVESTYDLHIAQAFVRNVVPYPVGTIVRLTNGVKGIVVENNKTNASRPVIRELERDHTFSLFDSQTLFIKEVLSSRDLCFSKEKELV